MILSIIGCVTGCVALAIAARIEWRHYQAQKAYRQAVADMRREWQERRIQHPARRLDRAN